MILNEKWIRENALDGQTPSAVEELNLAGLHKSTKITSLGISLRSFVNLRILDLSRNALESLEGIEELYSLERLNLYHNKISTLDEVTRLCKNTSLKDLDLRLNAVVNHPDYRLFTIYHIPSLHKLDGSIVRIHEKKRADETFGSKMDDSLVGAAGAYQRNSGAISPVRDFSPLSSCREEENAINKPHTTKFASEAYGAKQSFPQKIHPSGSISLKPSIPTKEDYSEFTTDHLEIKINKVVHNILSVISAHLSEIPSLRLPETTNNTFKSDIRGLIVDIFQEFEEVKRRDSEEINRLRQLRKDSQIQAEEAMILQNQLQRTMESCRIDRESLLEQNAELTQKLHAMQQECNRLHQQLDTAIAQKQDNEEFVKQSSSLVEMLKQSHEALLQNNENLLGQIRELKQNYDEESQQWHHNYQQLRRTIHQSKSMNSFDHHNHHQTQVEHHPNPAFESIHTAPIHHRSTR